MRIGSGSHTYQFIDHWADIPDTESSRTGWAHHGVVVTDNDEVIAFHPGDPEMLVFDLNGNLLRSWTTDLKDAHGMALAKDESGQYLWTSDPGAKRVPELNYEYQEADGPREGQVVKWSLDGDDVLRLERPDLAAYNDGDYSPTSVTVFEEARGGNGDIWSSDGYGQSLIHRYDKSGNYISTIDGAEATADASTAPTACGSTTASQKQNSTSPTAPTHRSKSTTSMATGSAHSARTGSPRPVHLR